MDIFVAIAFCFVFFIFGGITVYLCICAKAWRQGIDRKKEQTSEENTLYKKTSDPKSLRKKKKLGTMDIILLVIGAFLLIFTIYMIVLFREYGMIPDTLVTCVFATLAGECGIMGWIKTTKDRRQERKWEIEDRSEMNDLDSENEEE